MGSKLVFMAFVILSFASCTQRYFKGFEEVQSQLKANQRAYEQLAREWAQQYEPNVRFFRFSDDRWRWDDYYIERKGNGYRVGKGKYEGPLFSTLADVAKHVGTSERELAYWMAHAEALHIYAIHLPENGYVELSLRGSHWGPYGLRYALSEDSQRFLLAAVARGGVANTDRQFRHIQGPWFYFEAKHL